MQGWDYSNPWWYYVTINTRDHRECFGEVIAGKMKLNQYRDLSERFWREIPSHFDFVELDYHVVMPNHIHGIIIMNPQQKEKSAEKPVKLYTLANIIGAFKSIVTREVRRSGMKEFAWQERYYDRIIRNDKELYNIRRYIEENPLRWEIDRNTDNIEGI